MSSFKTSAIQHFSSFSNSDIKKSEFKVSKFQLVQTPVCQFFHFLIESPFRANLLFGEPPSLGLLYPRGARGHTNQKIEDKPIEEKLPERDSQAYSYIHIYIYICTFSYIM